MGESVTLAGPVCVFGLHRTAALGPQAVGKQVCFDPLSAPSYQARSSDPATQNGTQRIGG
jgi:hypothetical protein